MTEKIGTPNPWDRNREYEKMLVELYEQEYLREAEVVWLESPETFPYVREQLVKHPHRKTRPGKERYSDQRIVAYSTAAPDAKAEEPDPLTSGKFYRRVWYVMKWDPYDPWDPKLGGPMEAVDPETVRSNKPSLRPGHDLRKPGPAGQRKADAEGTQAGKWVSRDDKA